MTAKFRFTKKQEAWLQDLEKTRARQTEGYLHDEDGWCCLGRACKVLGVPSTSVNAMGTSAYEFGGEDTVAPPSVVKALRLRDDQGGLLEETPDGYICLTALNDLGWTFKQIAKYIRENPRNVFTNYDEKVAT